jgi:murein DD-endopeptidase MepM/ murein hydrolase activator NlpD
MSPGRRLRPGLILALGATVVLLCCGGGVFSFFLDAANQPAHTTQDAFGCGNANVVDANANLPSVSSLGSDQMHNAAVIIRVGQQMQVPPRGWVIAIATSLQEARLRNLPNLGKSNDHDSVGLFQQRTSQGWGSVQQIMDPEYSSRKFYEHLLTVKNWESRSLTDAAQTVQRSAFPDAYAKHEPLASQVVNAITGGGARAVGALPNLRCTAVGEVSASGWTVPVKGTIVSGFRTASRPTHQGVDIAVPKGTAVHAAAAGTVIKMRCNAIAPDGSDWGCYRDGSPNIRGCGWYVDILHAGSFVTRYCHMVTQPLVSVGQQVAPGQQIGLSGSTGNSSGPHLHFETHVNGDSSKNGAVDPVRFMQDVGAPLGAAP